MKRYNTTTDKHTKENAEIEAQLIQIAIEYLSHWTNNPNRRTLQEVSDYSFVELYLLNYDIPSYKVYSLLRAKSADPNSPFKIDRYTGDDEPILQLRYD